MAPTKTVFDYVRATVSFVYKLTYDISWEMVLSFAIEVEVFYPV